MKTVKGILIAIAAVLMVPFTSIGIIILMGAFSVATVLMLSAGLVATITNRIGLTRFDL